MELQERFSEGYVKIILEGYITGHKISPFYIVVKKPIIPKKRDKVHAKWRLEQTSINACKTLEEKLKKEIKAMKNEEN